MDALGNFYLIPQNLITIYSGFKNGGSYILAADSSPESVLSVWQWQWGHLLGKVAVIAFFSAKFIRFPKKIRSIRNIFVIFLIL